MIFSTNGFKFSAKDSASNASTADVQSKSSIERSGKNDDLFKSLKHIEDQVDAIVSNGTKKYIDGIKQNILDTIFSWVESNNGRFFFLFGNMGTGKSFFSARLYSSAKHIADTYAPVIYSSQQSYPATTNIENMLLVTAARLCRSIPEYCEYYKTNELGEKDIDKLTEKVLIEPFERINITKKVLIILDGLDEYSKNDCVKFLDALTRLAPRMSSNVNIFFSSRPERYIRSHLPSHSQNCEYMIEKQETDCQSDCLAFIRAKSNELGIDISETTEKTLIEKSKYCLKYLQCVFDDSQAYMLLTQDGTVDKLPDGLLSFYREQLIRYFSDENVYRNDYLPLLEVICAAYRPMSVSEIADILECKTDHINDLILRAGTLIYKSNDIVYLYQSESIKPYLSDERNCPENFLVKPDNGRRRILNRISELIEDEDLDSNDYLLFYAADHILDMAEENDNEAWNLLFKLINANVHQRDVLTDLCVSILTKSQKTWSKFIQKLFKNQDIDPVIKDNLASMFCTRAAARNLTPSLIEVVSKLSGVLDFRYYELLIRIRYEKNNSYYDEALKHSHEALEIIETGCVSEALKNMRLGYIYDEIQRVQRLRNDGFRDIVEYAAKMFEVTELSLNGVRPHDPTYPIMLRNFTVSYDQFGRIFDKYSAVSLSRSERKEMAEKLCSAMHVSAVGAEKNGFFIRQAIYCHEKSLENSKRLQMLDSGSKFRLYDLTYSLIALGKLYSKNRFPGRNIDKAIKYLEDCLAICEKLSERAIAEANSTRPIDMRYARAPLSAFDELVSLYQNEGNYQKCIEYITRERALAELLMSRYPSNDNIFSVALTYEYEARLKNAVEGIIAAEPMFVKAAEIYTSGAEEWRTESLMRAPGIVFDTLSKELESIEKYREASEYRRKTLEIDRKVFVAYPTTKNEFYVYVDTENLADSLVNSPDASDVEEAIKIYTNLIVEYTEFAKRHPQENYERAPLCIYDALYNYYTKINDYETAQKYVDEERALAESLLKKYPNAKNALSVALVNKYDAYIALARFGAEQVEAQVLALARACEEIAKTWETESILHLPGYIYDRLAESFDSIGNIDKTLEYRRLSMEVDAKSCELYPSETNEHYYTIDMESYADALMKTGEAGYALLAVDIYKDVIARYMYLGQKYSEDKYARSPLGAYDSLILYYTDNRQFDDANQYITLCRAMVTSLLERKPNAKNYFSLGITYEREAKIVRMSSDMHAAEPIYLKAIEIYTSLLQFDDAAENHIISARYPYTALAIGFEEANDYEKAKVYRRKLLDFNENILERFPTLSNEWTACLTREKLAEILHKHGSDDEKLESIWLYRTSIERYNALAAKTKTEIHMRAPLSVYDMLFYWYKGKGQLDEAEKYMREERELALRLYESWPNARNDFSINYTYEFEALLVQAKDGDAAAEPLFLDLIERYKKLSFTWKTEVAIRSTIRVYATLVESYKATKSIDSICSISQSYNKFIDEIMGTELDDACRINSQKRAFSAAFNFGEMLINLNSDKTMLAAIESFELSIVIGSNIIRNDQDYTKHTANAIKKLDDIFTQIKVMIKFLHRQNNPTNKSRLLSYLETEIRIINFLRNCISNEMFESKYSETLEQFRKIFESLS